jgi:hypothetical protein
MSKGVKILQQIYKKDKQKVVNQQLGLHDLQKKQGINM